MAVKASSTSSGGNTSYQGVMSQIKAMSKGSGPVGGGDEHGLKSVVQGLADLVGLTSELPSPGGGPAPEPSATQVKGPESQSSQGPQPTQKTSPGMESSDQSLGIPAAPVPPKGQESQGASDAMGKDKGILAGIMKMFGLGMGG